MAIHSYLLLHLLDLNPTVTVGHPGVLPGEGKSLEASFVWGANRNPYLDRWDLTVEKLGDANLSISLYIYMSTKGVYK